jgi:DNA-binding transcriptional LysR family regulator
MMRVAGPARNPQHAQAFIARAQAAVAEQLDWNDLRYFLAIARAGSLAGAAQALGVNHSTVFRRLNAFEDRLGVRLFERLPEGYAPTPEGEDIRRHAEAMDESVNALARSVAGRDGRLSGRIRLTTASTLASDYVAGYVRAFRDRYPDIQVEIATGDHDFDLNRREADVALRATQSPPEQLVGRKVLELPWYVCAGKESIARHGAPASMADLGNFPLIGADDGFVRLPPYAWLRRTFAEGQFAARAGDIATIRALTLAGLGVTVLPGDQYCSELVHLFPVEPAFVGQLWLLTHPDLRHVARIRSFMDFLAESLRADPRIAPRALPVAPRS